MPISREDQVKIVYGSDKAPNEAAPQPPSSELPPYSEGKATLPSPQKSRWAIVKTMLNFEVWQWVISVLVVMVAVLTIDNFHSLGAKIGSGVFFLAMAFILPIECKRDIGNRG